MINRRWLRLVLLFLVAQLSLSCHAAYCSLEDFAYSADVRGVLVGFESSKTAIRGRFSIQNNSATEIRLKMHSSFLDRNDAFVQHRVKNVANSTWTGGGSISHYASSPEFVSVAPGLSVFFDIYLIHSDHRQEFLEIPPPEMRVGIKIESGEAIRCIWIEPFVYSQDKELPPSNDWIWGVGFISSIFLALMLAVRWLRRRLRSRRAMR